MVPLAVSAEVPTSWWLGGKEACPDDARVKGASPPRGIDIGCVKPSGVWHGPRTQWFEKCTNGSSTCIRVQGEYRRGIEHGHWVWYRPTGERGLEGDYWAGKKTGVWLSWDAQGNERRSQFETFSSSPVEVDAAIQQALEAARAVGNKELGRELDAAARDLKRGQKQKRQEAKSRGHEQSATIGADVSFGESDLDLPDEDLGGTDFGAETNTKTTPYIRQAVKGATRVVNTCYRRARAKRPRLSGELVVRYLIGKDGRVTSVRVVKSTLTESMNQCVKKGLRKVKLKSHKEPQPIEVITPWTFRAG